MLQPALRGASTAFAYTSAFTSRPLLRACSRPLSSSARLTLSSSTSSTTLPPSSISSSIPLPSSSTPSSTASSIPSSTASPLQSPSSQKPYYVTTPIFYVNAAPHAGHLYSMVLADIYKRWQLLKRPPVPTTLSGSGSGSGSHSPRQSPVAILSTGTDEHGMKVQRASLKAGAESPKLFCDTGAEQFRNLAAAANISNDHFIRTTDPAHREAVQYAWSVLQDQGHIYMGRHEGWYSVSDETFYPQSQVHAILEPATGRKIMASIETGKEVEWTSETTYKFRLSAFRDQLLQFYTDNPNWIQPAARMKDVVQSVTGGLEDLSVSRPAARLSWGIPVPTDETQTIYVWLDALINYVTVTGYPWQPGAETAGGWPADLQIIGKDIVRFHCIYWPAFLLALGNVPRPGKMLVHSHWTLGKEKMSKSTGNVVNPFFALNRFGVDVMRTYLAHDGGIEQDADYTNEMIIERYRTLLQGQLGNLASRVMRGKGWDVRRAVQQAHSTGSDPANPDASDSPDPKALQRVAVQCTALRETPRAYADNMESHKLGAAMRQAFRLVAAANAFMNEAAPWGAAKVLSPTGFVGKPPPVRGLAGGSKMQTPPPPRPDLPPAARARLQRDMDQSIYLLAESLRLVAIMLLPVMPSKMAELLDMLGVAPGARHWAYATLGADKDYGVPTGNVDLGRGLRGVLFPPLTVES